MLSWLVNTFFSLFDVGGITDSTKVDLGASMTLTEHKNNWKAQRLLDPIKRQKPVPEVGRWEPSEVEIKRSPRPVRAEDANKKQ